MSPQTRHMLIQSARSSTTSKSIRIHKISECVHDCESKPWVSPCANFRSSPATPVLHRASSICQKEQKHICSTPWCGTLPTPSVPIPQSVVFFHPPIHFSCKTNQTIHMLHLQNSGPSTPSREREIFARAGGVSRSFRRTCVGWGWLVGWLEFQAPLN